MVEYRAPSNSDIYNQKYFEKQHQQAFPSGEDCRPIQTDLSLFISHFFENEKDKDYDGWLSTDTWLILPVVICLSQRLSHARVSINKSIL